MATPEWIRKRIAEVEEARAKTLGTVQGGQERLGMLKQELTHLNIQLTAELAAANAAREKLEGKEEKEERERVISDGSVTILSCYDDQPFDNHMKLIHEGIPGEIYVLTTTGNHQASINIRIADLRRAIDEVAGPEGKCPDEQLGYPDETLGVMMRKIAREEVQKHAKESNSANPEANPANRKTPYCPVESCIICPFHDQDREGCMHIYARQALGDPIGVFVCDKDRTELSNAWERARCGHLASQVDPGCSRCRFEKLLRKARILD